MQNEVFQRLEELVKKNINKGKELDTLEHLEGEKKNRYIDALSFKCFNISGPFVSDGPNPEATSRWIMGDDPRDIAPGLTRKEASAWLRQKEFGNHVDWFWNEVITEYPELKSNGANPTDANVVRWVLEKAKEPKTKKALIRERNGLDGYGRVIDRLDELAVEDLYNSVNETIRRADERIIKQKWDGDNKLTNKIEGLPSFCTHLYRFSDLMFESKKMRHCAVTYPQTVKEKKYIFFSIRLGGDRSTLVLDPDSLKINQHVGLANSSPPERCVSIVPQVQKAVEKWMEKNSL